MKLWQLEPFHIIFDLYLPRNICEIGTHHGRTACQFVQYLAPRVKNLQYTGYDLFEQADAETAKQEHNGKGPGLMMRADRALRKMQSVYPNFQFNLIKGNTRSTMTSTQIFDFVYIDGGHSYDTVMHDFAMIRGSQAVVFDDCQIPGVRRAVDEISAANKQYLPVPLPVRQERLKRQQLAMFWKPGPELGSKLVQQLTTG